MGNIITYIETCWDSFEERPFNEVDSLVLAQFSYINLPEVAKRPVNTPALPYLRDLMRAEYFEEMFAKVPYTEDVRKLVYAMVASPRFRNIRLGGYINNIDEGRFMQFSAATFLLDEKTAYIAFRGTDGTFIGWKEDFNMSFELPVPAQVAAADYLEATAQQWNGELMVGGHSKGGNLAVYAASVVPMEVQSRIKQVYSHDGPGFRPEFLENEGFLRVLDRINTTVPQSSIVGMLMERKEEYSVVKSTGVSLTQHNPFTWVVTAGEFEYLGEITKNSRMLDDTISKWLLTVSDEERKQAVDVLFEALSVSKATSVTDFTAEWQKNIPAVLGSVRNLSPETRGFLSMVLKQFAAIAVKNLPFAPKQQAPTIAQSSDATQENAPDKDKA